MPSHPLRFSLWLNKIPWYLHFILLALSCVDGHIGMRHSLSTVSCVAIDMDVQVVCSVLTWSPYVYTLEWHSKFICEFYSNFEAPPHGLPTVGEGILPGVFNTCYLFSSVDHSDWGEIDSQLNLN